MSVECETCHKNFKNQAALKIHEKRLHGENVPYFVCPSCYKTIRYIKNFAKHFIDSHKSSQEDAKLVEKTLVAEVARNVNDIPGNSQVLIINIFQLVEYARIFFDQL